MLENKLPQERVNEIITSAVVMEHVRLRIWVGRDTAGPDD